MRGDAVDAIGQRQFSWGFQVRHALFANLTDEFVFLIRDDHIALDVLGLQIAHDLIDQMGLSV